MLRFDLFGEALFLEAGAGHTTGGHFRQRHPDALGHIRHCPGGARIHFQHIHLTAFHGKLHVHQTDHTQLQRHIGSLLTHHVLDIVIQRVRRQGAGGVTGVHAGLFDVLHDATDNHIGTVTHRIHIHFDGIVQEAIQQHRRIIGHRHGIHHVVTQFRFAVHDFHGATTQHIGRTHHQRVTDFFRQTYTVFHGTGGAVGRLLQAKLVDHLLEAFAIFRFIDGIRRGANNGHAGSLQSTGQLQRGLPAVLDDHTLGFFFRHDGQHVFQRNRLEVQAIGGIVIGGHGFRVTVDHDGFITVVLHGKRRVHTAVIELDTLTDPVGATTDDHDLVTVGGIGLTLFIVAGVHVGRIRGEFCRAGIHPLVDRQHTQLFTLATYVRFLHPQQLRQAGIGKALALERIQAVAGQTAESAVGQLLLGTNQIFDLYQVPAIDLGDIEHIVHGHTDTERIANDPDALRARRGQQLRHLFTGIRRRRVHMGIKTDGLGFQTTQCFLYGFLEVTANGHHFTHRFHLRGQDRIGFSEFFEVEARNLGDHVINGWLEGSRGLAAGNFVLQLIQGVTHRQLGRHLGNRKARRLGRQGRRTTHPRIHLDHHHAPVIRVDAELHVGAAGFHADLTQHRQRGVTHDLQLFIGKRLGRRHGDGVTGMHTHGIKVFDGANDDAVVLFVADHFHLVLFPAQQRLVDQQLIGGRQIQTALADFFKLFAVVCHTTARAPHGETGANDAGETQGLKGRVSFVHVMGNGRARALQTDGLHCLIKTGAIFRLVDGIFGGANHFHAELFQHPIVVQVQGTV